ncbi:hypothetical protein SBA1_480076 [Candidatus Sulfotelmatobacter kueseliae]|uniref:Uncharacterized protein n=1 Tax=Candidatus Sulfotelmatobacter kueseliae TaxID=2042962 RepID=A0A2U3KU62_9BACT|nr:hypothetical protein SBA1_480076 [Candidatus Sulfotelmatobacter kueseliae]
MSYSERQGYQKIIPQGASPENSCFAPGCCWPEALNPPAVLGLREGSATQNRNQRKSNTGRRATSAWRNGRPHGPS